MIRNTLFDPALISDKKYYDASMEILKKNGYQSNVDMELTFDCQYHAGINDGYISGIESAFLSYYGDRMFKFSCQQGPIDKSQCQWKGYVNALGKDMTFNCPEGSVVTGVHSKHNDWWEDREWKFKCCQVKYKIRLLTVSGSTQDPKSALYLQTMTWVYKAGYLD